MYNFTIQLTEEDYINYNITHFFNAPINKKNKFTMQYITPLIMALLSPLFALLLRRSTGVPPVFVYATFGIAIILYMVRFKHFIRATITKNIDKMKKSGKLPFDINSTLIFAQDEITGVSENGETKVYYSTLEKIDHDEHAFYIYYSAIQAFIIPFKVFENMKKQEEFKAFIQSIIDSNMNHQ